MSSSLNFCHDLGKDCPQLLVGQEVVRALQLGDDVLVEQHQPAPVYGSVRYFN